MSNESKKSELINENSSDIQIRQLTDENRRLSREVEALKKELDELNGKSGKRAHADKYCTMFEKRSSNEYMFSRKNYGSFMLAQLKSTSFFHVYRRVIAVFRRYSFITTSLKVFSLLFLFVEATLLVLVSTSAFIASLAFTLLISYLFGIFTLFARKKHNLENAELLKQKNVTVHFPPKQRAFDPDSYFSYIVKTEAMEENSTVIIVSPYSASSWGLNRSKKPYLVCRADGENVILVRKSYYFTLRKHVIEKVAA